MSSRAIRAITLGITIGAIFVAGVLCLMVNDYEISYLSTLQQSIICVGCFISVLGIIFGLIFYRCGGCFGLLSLRRPPREQCPHCGDKLS